MTPSFLENLDRENEGGMTPGFLPSRIIVQNKTTSLLPRHSIESPSLAVKYPGFRPTKSSTRIRLLHSSGVTRYNYSTLFHLDFGLSNLSDEHHSRTLQKQCWTLIIKYGKDWSFKTARVALLKTRCALTSLDSTLSPLAGHNFTSAIKNSPLS